MGLCGLSVDSDWRVCCRRDSGIDQPFGAGQRRDDFVEGRGRIEEHLVSHDRVVLLERIEPVGFGQQSFRAANLCQKYDIVYLTQSDHESPAKP